MQSKAPEYSIMVKVTPLIFALLIYTKGMQTPALATIAAAFPDVPESIIKLIDTIPALMMCVFSLLTGWMTTRLSLKKCALIACVLHAFGVLPIFGGGIRSILLSRVIFGAGYGMIQVLASAIITDLFAGNTKSTLMGLKSGLGALAGIVLPLLGGILVVYDWRYCFIDMLLSVPILLIIAFFLPDTGAKKSKSGGMEGRLTRSLFLLILLAFLLNAMFYSFMMDMSFVVKADNLGTPAQAGSVISMFSAFTFVGASCYVLVEKLFKQTMPGIAALFLGSGLLTALYAPNLTVLYVAGALFGLGFGFTQPCLALLAASCVTDPARSPQALSLYVASTGVAQFLSVYIFAFLKNLLGLTSVRADWQIAGYSITAGAVIVIVVLFSASRRKSRA